MSVSDAVADRMWEDGKKIVDELVAIKAENAELRKLLSSCRAAMRVSAKYRGALETDWSHLIAAINAAVAE